MSKKAGHYPNKGFDFRENAQEIVFGMRDEARAAMAQHDKRTMAVILRTAKSTLEVQQQNLKRLLPNDQILSALDHMEKAIKKINQYADKSDIILRTGMDT